jgi:hypothetical protein
MDQIGLVRPGGKEATNVVRAVQQAAERHGVDFNYLMDVARVESGMVPTAKAPTSSARGLYQFTTQTWLATVDRHGAQDGLGWAVDAISRDRSGRYSVADPEMRSAILALRDDPATSASMAARFTEDNKAFLQSRTGREPEAVDLYLAHFLGAGGASNFLSAWNENPDQAGAVLFPAAAAANRTIFYGPEGSMRSLDEIRTRFRARLEQDTARPLQFAVASGANALTSSSTRSQQLEQRIDQKPLQMLSITKMPNGLSLDFAIEAYRRFSSSTDGVLNRG